ncbi:MAG: hypothetical protein WA102_08740 [Candidatus Methanoperedens sp.]
MVDTWAIMLAIIYVIGIFGIFFLVKVIFFNNPPFRIKVKGSNPIEFPNVCVITGEPATKSGLIRFFKGDLMLLQMFQINLPFSENGWNQYSNQFPLSLKIFRYPIDLFINIPVLGVYLAMFLWAPLAAFICGYIAIIDLMQHKRQLVKVHELHIEEGNFNGIDISVSSKSFAQEFNHLNGLGTEISTSNLQFYIKNVGIFDRFMFIFIFLSTTYALISDYTRILEVGLVFIFMFLGFLLYRAMRN